MVHITTSTVTIFLRSSETLFSSKRHLIICISEVTGTGNTMGWYKQKLKIANDKLDLQ